MGSAKPPEPPERIAGTGHGSGNPRLTGADTNTSIGGDRGWAIRSLDGAANTFHDQQGCGILSVHTHTKPDGGVSHRDHCGLPPPPTRLASITASQNTAHALGRR